MRTIKQIIADEAFLVECKIKLITHNCVTKIQVKKHERWFTLCCPYMLEYCGLDCPFCNIIKEENKNYILITCLHAMPQCYLIENLDLLEKEENDCD